MLYSRYKIQFCEEMYDRNVIITILTEYIHKQTRRHTHLTICNISLYDLYTVVYILVSIVGAKLYNIRLL